MPISSSQTSDAVAAKRLYPLVVHNRIAAAVSIAGALGFAAVTVADATAWKGGVAVVGGLVLGLVMHLGAHLRWLLRWEREHEGRLMRAGRGPLFGLNGLYVVTAGSASAS